MVSFTALLLLFSMQIGTNSVALAGPNVVPVGASFLLQMTVQNNGTYYLGYSATTGFTTLANSTTAVPITLDSTDGYLYYYAPVSTSGAGWTLPVFYTGGTNTINAATHINSADIAAKQAVGYYPVYCVLGATAADGSTAPLTCSLPGSGYTYLAACGGIFYAYNAAVPTSGNVRADGTCAPAKLPGGRITALTAILLPSPVSTSSSSSAATSSNKPAALFTASGSTSGSCSVAVNVYMTTSTVYMDNGALTSAGSMLSGGGSQTVGDVSGQGGGGGAAAANVVGGSTYGCIPGITTMSRA